MKMFLNLYKAFFCTNDVFLGDFGVAKRLHTIVTSTGLTVIGE